MEKKSNFNLYAAEFFGTFFFLVIGIGSVAVLVTGMSDISYPAMALCWGGAVALAIYVVGSVSGAHINPAVTIALTVWSGFDKKKAVGYIVSQIIGGFCAAALVYLLFSSQIIDLEAASGWVRGTADGSGAMGIFVTSAAEGTAMWKAFLVEVVLTAFLILTVYAVTDDKNGSAPSAGIGAIAIGSIVFFCGAALGPLTGFAMNTARDFGPRLFVALAGWGSTAWGANGYGLIVPIFAPIVGGILGGGVYKIITRLRAA